MNPRCLIVADDLTGACDSAVHFAEAVVALGEIADLPEVLAVSTESRDLPPPAACSRVAEIAARFERLQPAVVFKKIDSTVRGNTWHEIAAAIDAFHCDTAIVNPAFPALGRVVHEGMLRITHDAGFQAVDVRASLQAHVADVIASGARCLSFDAVCEQDLTDMVAEGLALPGRILWAGSGGLAAALARQLYPGAPGRPRRVVPAGPVLFCLGSDHPVTIGQQERLLTAAPVRLFHAAAGPADLSATLAQGQHVVLRIPRGQVPPEHLRTLLADLRPAATLVSGGDTATAVCHALNVEAIRLSHELAPGIPAGIIRGGPWHGAAIATKSGGFGNPDALAALCRL